MVFQDGALFPHLSVWRNVAYGLRGTTRRAARSRAVEVLATFGIDIFFLSGLSKRSEK